MGIGSNIGFNGLFPLYRGKVDSIRIIKTVPIRVAIVVIPVVIIQKRIFNSRNCCHISSRYSESIDYGRNSCHTSLKKVLLMVAVIVILVVSLVGKVLLLLIVAIIVTTVVIIRKVLLVVAITITPVVSSK